MFLSSLRNLFGGLPFPPISSWIAWVKRCRAIIRESLNAFCQPLGRAIASPETLGDRRAQNLPMPRWHRRAAWDRIRSFRCISVGSLAVLDRRAISDRLSTPDTSEYATSTAGPKGSAERGHIWHAVYMLHSCSCQDSWLNYDVIRNYFIKPCP